MYYQTPKMDSYVTFILKNRLAILVLFIFTSLAILMMYQPRVHSSDAMFWLKDSKEFKKTTSLNYDTFYLSKLSIKIDNFDDKEQEKLQEIQAKLQKLDNVRGVTSLFSHNFVKQEGSQDSSMVGVVNFGSMPSYKLKEYIDKLSNQYTNFVDDDFHTFNFYITSSANVDVKGLNLKNNYTYVEVDYYVDWREYIIYILISIILLIVIFKAVFLNYISSISAILVVSLTTMITFSFISFITSQNDIHIVMPFITVSIAMVDYLYFYYRWHVSQFKTDKKNALIKMLNRNITPALWTSILTAIGLGSLLLVNSEIIRFLSLSLIVSSIVGYIVNLTFLPAFLSFFHIKHAHVNFAKLCYTFASNELHYSKKLLLLLLSLTFVLLMFGAYKVYSKSDHLFKLQVDNDQVMIMVPYDQIDLNYIHRLEKFSDDITKEFSESIDEVKSLASIVNELNSVNTQTDKLDSQALEQALFYLDLYSLDKEYYDKNGAKITITTFDIDKNKLIHWLKDYKDIDIYFVDKGSLLSSAMYEKTILLSASLFTALIIIGIIIGLIFRSYSMAFVGFIVNAIPIVWFGLIVYLLNIPLSLEILIAMSISVGLASDATIHFAFKFFRSRHFGRSPKHALEKMFFYAGIPVIVGSLILAMIFTLLGFSDIASLQQVGFYGSMLILMSLFTDLFILPVILLYLDKYHNFIKNSS